MNRRRRKVFVEAKPLSAGLELKSALVFSPLPCCVPCFNFPSIIMFPFALFTVHLRFLFNWKLVWIWIMQTERKYLLNKCACELITCQDSQSGGWTAVTRESAFVHHLTLEFSFSCQIVRDGKMNEEEKVNIKSSLTTSTESCYSSRSFCRWAHF